MRQMKKMGSDKGLDMLLEGKTCSLVLQMHQALICYSNFFISLIMLILLQTSVANL